MCFAPYLGIGCGVAGASQGDGTQLADAIFSPLAAQKPKFPTFFVMLDHQESPSKTCEACFAPYLYILYPILGVSCLG